MPYIEPVSLRDTIVNRYDEEELRQFCFDLGIDYESLGGRGKTNNATELVAYAQQYNRLEEIADYVRQTRPQTTLHMVDTPPPPLVTVNAPITFPIISLPTANPHFTGRHQLLDQLQASSRSDGQNRQSHIAITQAIAGLGGVGKTQLALAYAHQQRDNYDLIWWLNGSQTTQLDSDLFTLGQRLRLPLPRDDYLAARQLTLSWLSGTDRRCLLIYDNVDSLTPGELRQYLPGGHGHVLITSRNPHWGGVAQVVDVNVFAPVEAIAFFQERLGAADEPPLHQLAQALGYLPLALEHAAAYMETRQTDTAVYLNLFQTRRQALWARAKTPNTYQATITTTWNIAFEQIQTVPGAAELLALCCFLAPDDIPLDLLAGSFTEVEMLRDTPLSDELARADAEAALRRFSLLSGSEHDLSIHRLVQAVYRDQVGEEIEQMWLEAMVDLLSHAYHYDRYDMSTWAAAGQLLPHLQSVIAAAAASAVIDKTAYLNNEVGFLLQATGDYEAARPSYERALAIREKVLGAEHPDTAQSLHNLGVLLQAIGDYEEAQPYLEHALAIREKVLGVEHPDTAQSLHNLGFLLRVTGNYEVARLCYERALAIREKVLGAEHPDTAQSLNNLGALLRTTGDYEGTRLCYERALAINEKVLGVEHPETAQSLNNLGFLLRVTGDYEAARPCYERALAIREKALGTEHPDTARSFNNMGALLRTTGDYEGARLYLERALAIKEKVLRAEHPSTARSLGILGSLLQDTGDYEAAKPYLERALTIKEKVLGAEHPSTTNSLGKLGRLLQDTGDYEAARPYYERALTINEKVLGAEHPSTAQSLNNLGSLLQATGDYEAALPYYERALAIREKVLGEHPETAQSLHNLGVLFQATGDCGIARPYLERALAIRKKMLGPEHPDTAQSLNSLGILANYQKDLQEAVRLMRQALAIRERRLGTNHPDTQSSRQSLSVIESQLRGS